MFEWIHWLFDTDPFVPRPSCGGWTSELIWLTVTSDSLIWLAYMAIPFLLWQVIRKRQNVPERKLFILFILFIASCGFTHLLDMLTFYQPTYRLNGVVLALTAVVSWVTVLSMAPKLPSLMAMKSPEELQTEIERREEVERQLRTAQSDLERRVNERTRELATTNADLEEFAYVASHDLQEPMRKITSFSDLLVEELGDELEDDARDYLQRMQNAAKRMNVMIHDLLQLSRASAKIEQSRDVELVELVNDSLQQIDTTVREAGAEVQVEVAGQAHVAPVALTQVLLNLLGNALKYRRQDAPLTIRVSSREVDADTLEVTVADNGIGFEPQYNERIFKPFQRLHTRDQYPGTGIGLSVCRKIIERHGGVISAEGKSGEGATFRFTLPRRRA